MLVEETGTILYDSLTQITTTNLPSSSSSQIPSPLISQAKPYEPSISGRLYSDLPQPRVKTERQPAQTNAGGLYSDSARYNPLRQKIGKTLSKKTRGSAFSMAVMGAINDRKSG
jgi:hypothetical protein